MQRRSSYKIFVDGLRQELAMFDATKVNSFIKEVSGAIDAYNNLKKWGDDNKRKRFLMGIRRAAVKFLEASKTPHIPKAFPERISTKNGVTLLQLDVNDKMYYQRMVEAQTAMEKYLIELDEVLGGIRRRKTGKPPADRNGLIARIAWCYKVEFNCNPTSTPGKPFSNVIVRVFRYQTGKSPADVTRQVRAAIKAI